MVVICTETEKIAILGGATQLVVPGDSDGGYEACSRCGGHGMVDGMGGPQTCSTCGGNCFVRAQGEGGRFRAAQFSAPRRWVDATGPCPTCGGDPSAEDHPCAKSQRTDPCLAKRWNGTPSDDGSHLPHTFRYGKHSEYLGHCGGRGQHCNCSMTQDICHWCGIKWGGDGEYTCPDCIDGRKRVALAVPCPNGCGRKEPSIRCDCDPVGFVVFAHATVEVLPVVDLNGSRDALIREEAHIWPNDSRTVKAWRPGQDNPIWRDVIVDRYPVPGRDFVVLLDDVEVLSADGVASVTTKEE